MPLYVTARGLTTSLIPHPTAGFQIDFDFVDHRLDIAVIGRRARLDALDAAPVADFYAGADGALDDSALSTPIWTDAGGDPRRDRLRPTTTARHLRRRPGRTRFWLALVQIERVFKVFRSRFVGKVSPVHLFWGGLDLAVTRFSGRPAPPHPGGAPNCGPQVMHEAYSHEVSSAGYWPGPDGEGVFYSYAYPNPHGFARCRSTCRAPATTMQLGEFILPYEVVRAAPRPRRALAGVPPGHLRGGGRPAGWDRAALER